MHYLVPGTGRAHAGFIGIWAVLEAHEHRDLGADRAAVKLDRLLAAADGLTAPSPVKTDTAS
jgi:hypothetical protein